MKEAIRQDILGKRLLLAGSKVERLSRQIVHRFLALSELKESKSVMLYYPVKNEVRIIYAFEKLLSMGKKVCFPKVMSGGIVPIEVSSLGELSPGYLGIPEPHFKPDRILKKPDIVVVPGIAFDLDRYRIGFGKGFYDRFLTGMDAVKVGVCFDFQLLDKLPVDPFDVRMDVVISEKRKLGGTLWNL